jgi:hypothetical protein
VSQVGTTSVVAAMVGPKLAYLRKVVANPDARMRSTYASMATAVLRERIP